ncbi:MAG: stage II sporulation protein M [Candidatus Omnitrophica bacterium]|nr:stage II sporulation protein M [Candidatus Omnitrophota bacterium]
MLEMLLNPRKAERESWEMFFVGLVYASISILLVNWIFAQDPVLSKYSGMIVVTFCVMFWLPFMYYLIKYEEERDIKAEGMFKLLLDHRKAVYALLWLFLGLVVAFSFWYIVLSSPQNFKAQIETYCSINRPNNFNDCVAQYGVKGAKATAFLTSREKLFLIFANNMYVLIFTLVFSLIFGAGAIFVLAWNVSVIAAAVGIFTKQNLSNLPFGIMRYMVHGIPEIASYFVVALAGGIISVAVVKHDIHSEKFWNILQDSLNLIIAAVVILFIAALIEVFITPMLF